MIPNPLAGSTVLMVDDEEANLDLLEALLLGEAGLPPRPAGGGRLLQVLSNLVGNSPKFSPEGGRIRVTWKAGERELRVSVADSGLLWESAVLSRPGMA